MGPRERLNDVDAEEGQVPEAAARPDGREGLAGVGRVVRQLRPEGPGALLVDGPATYAAMFKLVEQARDHINLETYIFEDARNDATGKSFVDLLLQKQSSGVAVHLIYDSVGSIGTPAAIFKRPTS